MTLATVPRYDPARVTPCGDHAVVVGASMAGLLAARVLADAYADVTVVEGDRLPESPVPRDGVPQDRHPHALLEAGRATISDLLPGCTEAVIAEGAVLSDFSGEVRFYAEGDFLAAGPTRLETVSVTRPLFEHVVRRHVTALDAVRVRPDCRCTDYLLDEDGTTVEGIEVREPEGRRTLLADLVVDATGRTSRTPKWLETRGFDAPPVDDVRIDMAYSTTYVERPADDRRTFLVPPSAPRARGGMAAPVEGDRWVVNLQGVHGETPPTDRESFVEYAASLPVSAVRHLLDEHAWADDGIHHYPFPSNRRHRYEALDRFPDGLLVVGDAIASFNPVYAQGMSVAALEALVLHHALAEGPANLPVRFFDRVEPVVDVAWSLAVGNDFGFDETRGPKPRGTGLMGWYLSRLLRHAHTDGRLTDRFVRVLMMESPPSLLMRPRTVARVLTPVPRTDGPETERDRLGGRYEGEERSASVQ